MYESHFGFNGSPFQLNPDPAFYFDSRGHSNALAYLKFGAHQGEGFIVVTGEIGAGKTTLVRTLLDGLDPTKVVAAQVVSTQLESGELLQAILMAFGVSSSNASKAHLIARLEAFLTTTAAKGKRALLIIDEAQNLKHEAVEELRMLSNFQLGNHGLLQSFLVGQPELRGLLQSKSMEQLRQRVIASCHLGPLDQAETRAYVDHRLRRVGWVGTSPEIEPGTLDRVHHWTGGVPRRINRLCNRLLLGAFLAGARSVSPEMVDETGLELKGEIGEAITESAPLDTPTADASRPARASTPRPPGPVSGARTESAPQSALPARVIAPLTAATPAQNVIPPVNSEAVVRRPAPVEKAAMPAVTAPTKSVIASTPAQSPSWPRRSDVAFKNPIVCLVSSATDYFKAGMLAATFEGFPDLPKVIAVHFGAESDLGLGAMGEIHLPQPPVVWHLGIAQGPFATHVAQLLPTFDALLSEHEPRAVFVMGSCDADLACTLLTRRRGFRLLRTVSGQRNTPQEIGPGSNPVLIDKNADLLYTDSMETFYALYREGVRLDRVHSVGNLGRETLALASDQESDAQADGSALRAALSTEGGNPTVPLYWDAGTASRIARHLAQWLPAAERVEQAPTAEEPALSVEA